MARTKRTRPEPAPGLLRCSVCERDLPRDAFLTITVRDKRCKPGHTWTGPSYDCRECRNEQKRELRRKKAEAAGKKFIPRGDRAAWEEERRVAREHRKEERRARHQAWLDEQKALRERTLLHRQESPTLTCLTCGATKPRADFFPSCLYCCKSCYGARDARAFRRDRIELSDSYVKHRLSNETGLRWSEIPTILIDAKRTQLAIERIVNPRKRKTS